MPASRASKNGLLQQLLRKKRLNKKCNALQCQLHLDNLFLPDREICIHKNVPIKESAPNRNCLTLGGKKLHLFPFKSTEKYCKTKNFRVVDFG